MLRNHGRFEARWLGAAFLLALVITAVWATQATAGSPFVFQEENDYITLFEGSTPIFRYVRGEILPSGAPEDRRRSTYVHPLYSLDGKPLTLRYRIYVHRGKADAEQLNRMFDRYYRGG